MDTREKIIAAAEVLFARHGYAGTSLRDITEAAHVNVAAVNYHFGSKEGLLVEILDRVLVPINNERLALLDKTYGAGTPDLDEVLTAFLLPDLHSLIELRARNPELPQFVSRMYSENTPLMERVIGDQFVETRQRFGEAFARAVPNLSSEDLAFRITCIVGIVVYMFASVEAPGISPLVTGDVQTDLERMSTIARSILLSPTREVAIG